MSRGKKWAIGLGIVAAVLVATGLVVAWFLPTDEELASRLAAEAEKRLGVAITIGSVHWTLLPRPLLEITNIRTKQPEPIVVDHVTVHPRGRSLLRLKFAFERIAIRDAVFPRDSVRAFRGKLAPTERGDATLDRFEFRNVKWFSYSGIPVTYDGDVDFDADWRLRRGELRRPGADTPFTFAVTREGGADRWDTRIEAGGGTMNGSLTLETAESGVMRLSGTLAPRGVEVLSLMQTFNRRSVISGRAWGQTIVSAEGEKVGDLVRSLHTRTTFSIKPATITRFDLHKVVKTLGKERQGTTPLEELTGQLDTQNTEEGMRAAYTNLKARAAPYSATGQATLYRRQVDGSGVLYLDEKGTALPFTVKGPISKPKASAPPGALAAAVVKSGGIGARIKDVFRRLFDGDGAGQQ